MKVAVLVLYVAAFRLQIAGAVGVIQDVRESIANMRRFKSDLDIAAYDAEEHRADGPVVDLTRGQRTSDLADGSWLCEG